MPSKLLSGSSSICGEHSSSTREEIFQPRQSRFRCQQPAADSQRISSTISSTTCVRESLHGSGKSTICLQCAAESAPESTNTIPQFVLIIERRALKCALVGSTGSPLIHHLRNVHVLHCRTIRHAPTQLRPPISIVNVPRRSELRPHKPKPRLVEQGTEDPEHS